MHAVCKSLESPFNQKVHYPVYSCKEPSELATTFENVIMGLATTAGVLNERENVQWGKTALR